MSYGYDGDSHVGSIIYNVNGAPWGNLIYGYDPNGRINSESGTLATIKLPLAATAAYDAGNQLNNWNGGAVTVDGNGNITYDAMTGGSYGTSATG